MKQLKDYTDSKPSDRVTSKIIVFVLLLENFNNYKKFLHLIQASVIIGSDN